MARHDEPRPTASPLSADDAARIRAEEELREKVRAEIAEKERNRPKASWVVWVLLVLILAWIIGAIINNIPI